MKFSEKWLREWVNPNISTAELAEQLTMLGLEVDSVEAAAGDFSHVVVGDVLQAEQHPDADRLRVCSVSIGEDEPVQIVCGAANARAGIKVAVAMIGAVLPGNFKIKKSKLRGVVSCGMLCAASELGLQETSEGIIELPLEAPVGKNLREYLQLDDQIIDIDLTPNRGDCLSIQGVARDVAALNQLPVNAVTVAAQPVAHQSTVSVAVTATEACPCYLARVVKGIDPNAVTPLWLQERLRRSGIRSIHPVVDVTNYVMLELGQPMHGFDLKQIQGGLQVRLAKAGEKLTLLDETELTLHDTSLVIADDEKPLALAGIMGGLHSGVQAGSTDIVFEAAFFDPTLTSVEARYYGLQTDSSYRFARGVDFNLPERAMERATELLLEIAGGQAGPIVKVEAGLPLLPVISLRPERVKRLLGIDVPALDDKLQALGLVPTEQGWQVPSYRFDLHQEADLVEEAARLYGYHHIPVATLKADLHMAPLDDQPELAKQLVVRGFNEVMSYSFIAPAWQALFAPGTTAVSVTNPISADMAVMRSSLLPGLMTTCQFNLNRQLTDMKLFERGHVFAIEDGERIERLHWAGLVTGAIAEWDSVRAYDFYDLKGDVEALMPGLQFVKTEQPVLHPGQSAELLLDGEVVGIVGALHPSVLDSLKISQPVFIFELTSVPANNRPQFKPIPKFPAVKRDLAIIVDQSVEVGYILQEIRTELGAYLNSVRIFDIYQGQGIDEGKKSVALELVLQDESRTLVDEDIVNMMARVVERMARVFDATLRT